MIAVRYPADAVTGEEHGVGAGDRVWIVDPIDGTKNFADGVPIWATLLALQVDGRSVLGMASAPALGERYEAVRGAGASWNGRELRVSKRTLDDAYMAFSSVDEWLDGPREEAFRGLLAARRCLATVGSRHPVVLRAQSARRWLRALRRASRARPSASRFP